MGNIGAPVVAKGVDEDHGYIINYMIQTSQDYFTGVGMATNTKYKLNVYPGGPEGQFFINVIDRENGEVVNELTKGGSVGPERAAEILVGLAKSYYPEVIDGLRMPEETPTMMPGEKAVVAKLREVGLIARPEQSSGERLGAKQR